MVWPGSLVVFLIPHDKNKHCGGSSGHQNFVHAVFWGSLSVMQVSPISPLPWELDADGLFHLGFGVIHIEYFFSLVDNILVTYSAPRALKALLATGQNRLFSQNRDGWKVILLIWTKMILPLVSSVSYMAPRPLSLVDKSS